MNKLMDNHNRIRIVLDLKEISINTKEAYETTEYKHYVIYLMKFFKWFVKINKSDNKSEYLFCKSSYMPNYKTTFKSH